MLAQQKYLGNYLDVGSKEILIERAKLLGKILKKRRRNIPLEWYFSIPQEHPLTFKKNDVDGVKLQVDISCVIEGTLDDIKKQNILLRVWSCDEKISYREGLDSIGLKNKLEGLDWKRVILRFHFDLRNMEVKSPEPLYHLQVGGNPKDEENCWIPKQIKVPRYPYPPMDLILLCELVLVNFFLKESEELRKDPEWESLVRKSQEMFLRPYLTTSMEYLKTGTLLGNLTTLPNS